MTIVKTKDFLEDARRILSEGGLVAFPTETVYGLGADARNAIACRRIYEAKGRPSDNPLIVHIGEVEQLEELVREIPDKARKLMDAFWPGPLTLILKKTDLVPDSITGGLDTVAVRMPSHPVARELLIGTKIPVAAPSANLSGRPSPTCAKHVLDDLQGRIDMLIDGGPVEIGIESTILDVTGEEPVILRPGHITKEMIEVVIGEETERSNWDGKREEAPKAPGMKYRHYAPKGTLILLKGTFDERVRYVQHELQRGVSARIALLTKDQDMDRLQDYFPGVIILSYGNGDVDEASRRLYGLLRQCDDLDISVIYSSVFAPEGKGFAIMNRLEKAAACRIVDCSEV